MISHEIDGQDLAAALAFAIRGYPEEQQQAIITAFACGIQLFTGQDDTARDRFVRATVHWCTLARDSLDMVKATVKANVSLH